MDIERLHHFFNNSISIKLLMLENKNFVLIDPLLGQIQTILIPNSLYF